MLLDANVAQLVEQFTRNEQVAGSNPAISSKNNRFAYAGRLFLYQIRLRIWLSYQPFFNKRYKYRVMTLLYYIIIKFLISFLNKSRQKR